MISKKSLWQIISLLLIALLTIGCAGTPAKPPTATSLPETGSITGMMIDANGKPLVSIGDIGYVVLYCTENYPDVECLHEDYMDMDPSALLASICDITDQSSKCKVHLMTSAAKIGMNGEYTIPVVRPGQYDLILIVVPSGIMLTAHLLNVEPVEAGKVTKYDYPTK